MFYVQEYGATGDGTTFDTQAIQRTIQACVQAGGGTVAFDSGRYLTAPFELFSNVTLQLEAGATLLASPRIDDYFQVGSAVESARTGLIYARGASHITITGWGTIDLNGLAFMDMNLRHVPDVDGSHTRQGARYMSEPELGDGPAEFFDRPGDSLQFIECAHVTLQNITILDAPDWTVRFGNCNNVAVLNLTLLNNELISNSDGLHFTSCRNVRVANCHIVAGDDAIAITGYGALEQPTENIVVSNCTLTSRSSGIRAGIVGNLSNCVFQNLVIHANRGIGIFVRQEESVRNLLFSDIIIHTRLHTGNWWGQGEPIHISALRDHHPTRLGTISDIRFSNIQAVSESGIVLYGCEESKLENIAFDRVDLTIVPSKLQDSYGGNFDLRPTDDPSLSLFAHDESALYANYVKGLHIHDFRLRWRDEPASYCTHAIECEHSEDINIEGFVGRQAHVESEQAVIALNVASKVSIRNCTATTGSGTFLAAQNVASAKWFMGNDLAEAKKLANVQKLPFQQMNNILPES